MQNKTTRKAKTKAVILKAASVAAMLLSFVFIGFTFSKIDASVFKENIGASWIASASALTALYLGINVIRAFNWKLILQFLTSREIKDYGICGIYLRTEVAKYIPSNMVHFAGRHILTRKKGFSDKVLVAANILDMAFLLCAAGAIVFACLASKILPLPESVLKLINVKTVMAAACAGGLIFAAALIVRGKKIIGHIMPFLKPGKIARAGAIAAMYLPVFILNSVIILAVLKLMCGADISLASAAAAFAAFTFAWTIGFIVPGAPGGLGVRESVLIILLTPVFGGANALSAALISRVISIFGDVAAFALSHAKALRY